MPDHILRIRLYGPFDAAWSDGAPLSLRGTKTQALLALLATASEGKRTRAWLQDVLWGRSGPELGRASLRQAVHSMRATIGDRFDSTLEVTKDWIRLRRDVIDIVGSPEDGEFLEGIDVREERFEDWLREQRMSPPAAGAWARADRTARVTARATAGPVERTDTGARAADGGNARILACVAVMPFASFGGDPADSALGDAIAQEITRALSRSGILLVVSHLSARSMAIDVVGLDEIRDRLDIDYVVWGNLRVDGERLTVDLEVVDAALGHVLSSRTFAGTQRGFLAGDSDLVHAMAREVGRQIVHASVDLASAQPLPELQSHHLLMSGISMMHRQSLMGFSRARSQIEEVCRRAPNHALVHSWLAKWYILAIQQGWSVDRERDMVVAADCTARALSINPECPFSLAIDGFRRNNLTRTPDLALARFEEALAIDPNNALSWLLKGTLSAFMDKGDEAVACTTRARRLSPLDPYKYFYDSLSATACLAAGDFEAALALSERSLEVNRRHTSTLRAQIIALQSLGRGDEAQATVAELMRLDPGMTIERYLATHPAAAFRTGKEWARALKEAGVPAN